MPMNSTAATTTITSSSSSNSSSSRSSISSSSNSISSNSSSSRLVVVVVTVAVVVVVYCELWIGKDIHKLCYIYKFSVQFPEVKRKFLTTPGLKDENTTTKLSKQKTIWPLPTTFDKKYIFTLDLSQKSGQEKGMYFTVKGKTLSAGRQSVEITHNSATRPYTWALRPRHYTFNAH